MEEIKNKEWRTRLRFLVDLLFSATMTIMILGLEIPDLEQNLEKEQILDFAAAQLPKMGIYMITFVMISIYWLKHLEHFGNIMVVNTTFIWLELLFLLFLVILPFWNGYMTVFPEIYQFKILYSSNVFFVGIFSWLSLRYATHNHRLVNPELPNATILTLKKQAITEPTLAIIAIFAGLIKPFLWDLTFLSVPVFFALRKRISRIPYISKITGNIFKLKPPKT